MWQGYVQINYNYMEMRKMKKYKCTACGNEEESECNIESNICPICCGVGRYYEI